MTDKTKSATFDMQRREYGEASRSVRPKITRKVIHDPDFDPARTRRVKWARSLTDHDIHDLLQMKLMESRAAGSTATPLLNELVHEIKYRLKDPDVGSSEGTET